MDRAEVTKILKEAKRNKKITYHEIAEKLGKPKVWLTAAMHGQHPFKEEDARKLVEILEVKAHQYDIVAVLQEPPMRGELGQNMPPTDPTIYRLYEFLQVYGPALKDLIHEEFGDGIMSAIDANVEIKRRQDTAGNERVQIIFDGKFLPYKW